MSLQVKQTSEAQNDQNTKEASLLNNLDEHLATIDFPTEEELQIFWNFDHKLDLEADKEKTSEILNFYFAEKQCLTGDHIRGIIDLYTGITNERRSSVTCKSDTESKSYKRYMESAVPGIESKGEVKSEPTSSKEHLENLSQLSGLSSDNSSHTSMNPMPGSTDRSLSDYSKTITIPSYSSTSTATTFSEERLEMAYDILYEHSTAETEVDYSEMNFDLDFESFKNSEDEKYIPLLMKHMGSFTWEEMQRAPSLKEFLLKLEARRDKPVKHLVQLAQKEMWKLKQEACYREIKIRVESIENSKDRMKAELKKLETGDSKIILENFPNNFLEKNEIQDFLLECSSTTLKKYLKDIEYLLRKVYSDPNVSCMKRKESDEEWYAKMQSKESLIVQKCMCLNPELYKRQKFIQNLLKALDLCIFCEDSNNSKEVKKLIEILKQPRKVPDFLELHKDPKLLEAAKFPYQKPMTFACHHPVEPTSSADTLEGTEDIMEECSETVEKSKTTKDCIHIISSSTDVIPISQIETTLMAQNLPYIDEDISDKMGIHQTKTEEQVDETQDDVARMTLKPDNISEKRDLSPRLETSIKPFKKTKHDETTH